MGHGGGISYSYYMYSFINALYIELLRKRNIFRGEASVCG